MPYDRLLIATGSRPLVPPIPGLGLPGVCAFRDIADVDTMMAAASTHKRAVVIGGGLLGPGSRLGPEAARHVGGAVSI